MLTNFCRFILGLVASAIYACGLNFVPKRLFLPVLHNLESGQVNSVSRLLEEDVDCYSISLRHAGAMQAVEAANSMGRTHVGVSSASSLSDIRRASALGVDYISTRVCEKSLVKAALAESLPIMTGVSSIEEAVHALQWGSTALKFYPSSTVPPRKLKAIVKALHATYGSQYIAKVPMIVAGGVTEADLTHYLSAGATGFAVGFDCNKPLDMLRDNVKHFYRSAQMASWVTTGDLSRGAYIAEEERNSLFL